MALPYLLAELPTSDFIEQYYLKLPFAASHGAETFNQFADWSTIDRLLQAPSVDLLIASQRLGVFRGIEPRTETEARTLLADGYTLGFRHVQQCDSGLAELASKFAAELAAPVDIHLYCTPANEPGFGWHYDAEEVFVLQTFGSKEWLLRKNTVHPWPLMESLPADMAYEKEIMPLQRCSLKAGDWLYIPSGYWHATRATEESISLSVGIAAQSGIDFFDSLRDELLRDLRWRQRLPHAPQSEELQTRLAELAADLAKRLAAPSRASDFSLHTRHFGATKT